MIFYYFAYYSGLKTAIHQITLAVKTNGYLILVSGSLS